MGTAYNPRIVTDGLILCLDAGNPKNAPLTSVEYLIVGGGGGGGWDAGGGGGGGGVLNGNISVTPQSYTITIGAGGTTTTGVTNFASNGGNSSAFGITALGGGGGGNKQANGRNGASGGGGGHNNTTVSLIGGTSTQEQGDGGNGNLNLTGGGGGGASSSGEPGQSTIGGRGGDGRSSTITGNLTFYGGGGGGGNYSNSPTGGVGGNGGGGNASGASVNGSAGSPNTGGGGGAHGNASATQGPFAGGSGIVIIRYPGPQRATGGTVTTVGNDIVHTFTGNGTFTVLPAYTNNQAFDWVTDLSGNNKHGTPVNGPTFSTSNGGSFVFDGVDDYITVDYPSLALSIPTMTVSMWLKTDTTSPVACFGSYNNLSPNPIILTINLNRGNPNRDANSIGSTGFYIRDTSGSRYLTGYITTQIYDNIWHNIVWRIINSAANSHEVYIDGKLVTLTNTDTSSPSSFVNFEFPLGINSFHGRGSFNPSPNSSLGTTTIYNRALTAAEIQQNFQATRGRYGI